MNGPTDPGGRASSTGRACIAGGCEASSAGWRGGWGSVCSSWGVEKALGWEESVLGEVAGAVCLLGLAIAGAGVALILLHEVLVRLHDPNAADQAARIARGRELALPAGEVEGLRRRRR